MPAALQRRVVSVNKWFATICLWISGFGLTLMTAVIGYQVFCRYVLNDSPNWSEKFCLLLMIYYIMLAAAAGVRDKAHIGLTIINSVSPPWLQRIFEAFSACSLILFGIGMLWYGSQMVGSTWEHVIPTLGLSTGISYLPFPLAGALFILFAIELLMNAALGKEGD